MSRRENSVGRAFSRSARGCSGCSPLALWSDAACCPLAQGTFTLGGTGPGVEEWGALLVLAGLVRGLGGIFFGKGCFVVASDPVCLDQQGRCLERYLAKYLTLSG